MKTHAQKDTRRHVFSQKFTACNRCRYAGNSPFFPLLREKIPLNARFKISHFSTKSVLNSGVLRITKLFSTRRGCMTYTDNWMAGRTKFPLQQEDNIFTSMTIFLETSYNLQAYLCKTYKKRPLKSHFQPVKARIYRFSFAGRFATI